MPSGSRRAALLERVFPLGEGARGVARLASVFGDVDLDQLEGLAEILGSDLAEIASLYTLTRFVGEGVGGHLVRHAVESARERGLAGVFACTTSERVAGFFAQHGFEPVPSEALPASKWQGYDPERRQRLRCVRTRLR